MSNLFFPNYYEVLAEKEKPKNSSRPKGKPSTTRVSGEPKKEVKNKDNVDKRTKDILEEVKTGTHHHFEQVKASTTCCSRFWSWFVKTMEKNELLAIQIYLNICRDYLWTLWSYLGLDYTGRVTDDTDYDGKSEWAGQQIWGTGAMVIGLAPLMAFYKLIGRPFPLKAALIFIAGASAAIYTWDRGDDTATTLFFQNLGYSATAAAYLASLGTGLAEGPTQYAVITFLNFVCTMVQDKEKREEFWAKPGPALRYALGELGLSATIGAIPGAVWQIVYVACLKSGMNEHAASTFVAAAVAVCNGGTTKLNEKIVEETKKCCSKPPKTSAPLDSVVTVGESFPPPLLYRR